MDITVNKGLKAVAVALMMLTLAIVTGCQQGPNPQEQLMTNTLEVTQGADMQRGTEVQLVEQMGRFRQQYIRHLEMLKQFYDEQGNHMKSSWASQELEHLALGPQQQFLVVAEVAGPNLRATDSIPEADQLYQEGMSAFQLGRGAVGSLFIDQKKLYLARDKFNELITNYPSSDKIDDAAYQVGEIYHYYLKDYHKALLYYQRVWQWDPQTPKPARYAVARIYDDFLHERIKALEYYQQCINLETAYPSKVEYAKSRIRAISEDLAK